MLYARTLQGLSTACSDPNRPTHLFPSRFIHACSAVSASITLAALREGLADVASDEVTQMLHVLRQYFLTSGRLQFGWTSGLEQEATSYSFASGSAARPASLSAPTMQDGGGGKGGGGDDGGGDDGEIGGAAGGRDNGMTVPEHWPRGSTVTLSTGSGETVALVLGRVKLLYLLSFLTITSSWTWTWR